VVAEAAGAEVEAGAAGDVAVAGEVVTGLWAKAGVASAMAATVNKGRKLKDIELSYIQGHWRLFALSR
jgi:hypothetical protein